MTVEVRTLAVEAKSSGIGRSHHGRGGRRKGKHRTLEKCVKLREENGEEKREKKVVRSVFA